MFPTLPGQSSTPLPLGSRGTFHCCSTQHRCTADSREWVCHTSQPGLGALVPCELVLPHSLSASRYSGSATSVHSILQIQPAVLIIHLTVQSFLELARSDSLNTFRLVKDPDLKCKLEKIHTNQYGDFSKNKK